MSDPIFILGCHRSGTSVVAGLLYNACGVSMGELMPPTEDNPLGYYEALGVVDAHRDLLRQLELDWTCPPSAFRADALDLSALEEQIDIHKQLPGVWAMKDPRSMFLFPAWAKLGLNSVRLIAVVRPTADTVRSIEKRDGIRQDRAEAIVDAHLRRLHEIAERLPLPVIQFPGEEDSLLRQVRDLAATLDLPWDEKAARAFFDPSLVRNRSPLSDPSPSYKALIEKARYPKKVPTIRLSAHVLTSEPEWPLETHLAVRHAQQRNELWEIADFASTPEPDVVEILLDGARPGGPKRPGVTLRQVEVTGPMTVGATLIKEGLRPDGVVANGILAERSHAEIEFFFRSLYINTSPLAEIAVDAPDPHGRALQNLQPPPPKNPRPARIAQIASRCGWDHVTTERLSPGRSGMLFRKRVLTDSELLPVVTDLIAHTQRLHRIDTRLKAIEGQMKKAGITPRRADAAFGEYVPRSAVEAERARADAVESELSRLRNRRSVRFALALSRPFRPLFQAVRSWKKKP